MGDSYLPLRLRFARTVNRATWWAIFALPPRAQGWFLGDDPWEPRYVKWRGATVCRWLGHTWEVCVPTPGLLLHCGGCGMLWAADDPDAFHPGSRDLADAVVASWDDHLDRLDRERDRTDRLRKVAGDAIRHEVEHTSDPATRERMVAVLDTPRGAADG